MLKLSEESLNWAIGHAIAKGDTDIFPAAFEFQAIKHDWENIKKLLLGEDILRWMSRPLRKCLSPKRKYGFRVATQLDPLDFLILTSLVYEIGADIEAHRLPISNSVEQSVLSCRYAPDANGELFDPNYGYRSFQLRAIELAQSGSFSHVVQTDIADFFSRLYLHRVEGAISNATNKNNHVLALSRLLSSFNQTQSYGIPVGPAAARLIAEIAIDDVDKNLRSEGVTFVRYMDDYKIFVESLVEGYEHLTILANSLFRNHGLTLQQEKTSIQPVSRFLDTLTDTAESKELDRLSEKFRELLAAIGMEDYEDIEYDDLDESDREVIDSLNLEELLAEQLKNSEIDQSMTRFLLRRLGQMDNSECVDTIIDNIENTTTVFPQVVQYFSNLRSLTRDERCEIAERLLGQMADSSISRSEYHRVWLFSLFSKGTEWGNSESLARLHSAYQDNFSRRKLVLGLAESKQDYWFRTRKDDVFEFGGWLRRAFLAGARCLPKDESKHWYKFLMPRLDPLEKSVVRWARENPL